MTSTPATDGKDKKWTTRERPWLIPSNRKLRNLHSIALRNLALSQSHGQAHLKTFDDEALPNSLKSPAKLLALRESKQLGHSRSSADLRPIQEQDKHANGNLTNGTQKKEGKTGSQRPQMGKLRRRSTMEWAGSSPQQRQKKLEDVSATRMADVFFSLHVAGVKEPIYVSEVVDKTMNPNFRHIDLDGCGPGVSRVDALTVKFWVKSDKMRQYHILVELSLNLRALQFIGKELASFNHPFPSNCIIFQLTDGYYTCFTDAQVQEPVDPFVSPLSKAASSRTLPTSSFDALLRLSKLDDSIQDALALRDQLAADLDAIVDQSRDALADKSRVGEAEDFVKTIDYAKSTVEKQLRNLRKSREQKQQALKTRKDLLSLGRQEQKKGLESVTSSRPDLSKQHDQHAEVKTHISQQRRRICDDLQKIYPITPLPDRSLAFSIRGLHLPNSEDLDSTSADTVAGALGHAAHVTQLLSFYLAQPLPYPLHPRSSTSTISDPISIIKGNTSNTSYKKSPSTPTTSQNPFWNPPLDPQRTFPLFPARVPRFRFEYAVFLLNKDIELLLSNCFGIRVLDIRQTLPNLLYTLYCATAGEGELPARKAGGVRGLLRARRGNGGRDSGGGGEEGGQEMRVDGNGTGGRSMPASNTGGAGGDGGRKGEKDKSAVNSLVGNMEEQGRKIRDEG